MSSLNGIAQFTNRFTQNIMGYEEGKKKEAERVADKDHELARQAQQDKNAQESHDIGYQTDTLKLGEAKDTRTDSINTRNYGKTYNQVQYLKQLGDESGAIDAIIAGANSHSDLPYQINVDRDVNGKVASRTDENGNKYYFQNIIDKETGKVIRTDSVTYDQLMEGYTQLQNGQTLAAEKAAYEAEKRKQQEKDASELSLYGAKKGIDVKADNIKAQRDHIYKVDEMGIKHGYTIDELGIKHGYTIDLEGIKHANAVDLSNVNAQNNIGVRTAQSDLDAGGTPIVGGGGQGAVKVVAAGKGWTKLEMSDGSIVTAKGNRNFRNNNLGNIEYGPFAKANGAIGSDGRFAVFPDSETGVQAMENLIFGTSSYKNLPLTKAIARYAPKFENDTAGYAKQILSAVGNQNKPMSQYTASERKAIVRAMVAVEGKNNATYSGGIQVQRSVPGVPKAPKGSTKKAESGKGIVTAQDYNASIDKGVNTAIKGAKQLGVKPDAATTATFARAGTKLKEMGSAKNESEFLGLYQEAFDLVLDAVPERSRKKMSKADQNALGHKVLLSMVGASSLGNLKEIVYKINPSARSGGNSATANGLTLNLPGQQPQTRTPAKQTPQVGKLQGLYARGLPAPKTDPKATENLNYLENLNDNMDW